ncbi:uncharacterized protein K441DRAFT_662641 [Cenococcum geophilum 1.58]|uniref:uncharacterized protein n=1 Tax=Cenococcum geophilum 1.58 TaxID=794803 RepID=UPI00358F3CE4|nr:hypothetical protein K441DRAFT_662641 [Cenococcum geophilum 1.58]
MEELPHPDNIGILEHAVMPVPGMYRAIFTIIIRAVGPDFYTRRLSNKRMPP